jgi:uncharacterized protein DUF4189
MNLVRSLGALMVLWCLSIGVHAEGNCPSGYYPIGGGPTLGCAPIPDDGGASGGSQWQPYSAPEPVWEDRWGAIAGDEAQGSLGFAAGLPSETAAQQSAMADCAAKGSVRCKIENSYKNGCTAMTFGDWGYNIASMSTLDQAIASGMENCKKNDKNCKTAYRACSPPVRIR